MKDIGLYISDLSFQDSVQVLLVAGPQQSAELKISLDMVFTFYFFQNFARSPANFPTNLSRNKQKVLSLKKL